MKKVLLMMTALVVLSAVPAMAVITGSLHDFSDGVGTGASGTNTQICIYCHTPHNANIDGDKPLWNRTPLAVTAVYTNSVTGAGGNTTYVKIAPLCLSCHNGQDVNAALRYTTGLTSGLAPDIMSVDGDSLKGTHPIGFSYATRFAAGKASLIDPTGGTGLPGGGPLAAWFKDTSGDGGPTDTMDCTSCHDVHAAGVTRTGGVNGLFNAQIGGSDLCLVCHDK